MRECGIYAAMSRSVRILLLFCPLLLWFLPEQGVAQETVRVIRVITLDSVEVHGVIVRETDDSVVIRTELGIDVGFHRSEIAKLHVYRYRGEYLKETYWSLGATYGGPGLANLVIARNVAHEWQFRTVFGYVGSQVGLEFAGLYRFLDLGPSAHNILFGFGHSTIEEEGSGGADSLTISKEWTYFQFGYNVNIWGLDMSGTLSAGEGAFENPRYMFQVGFVYSFR